MIFMQKKCTSLLDIKKHYLMPFSSVVHQFLNLILISLTLNFFHNQVDRYKIRRDGQSTTLLIRECTYSDSAIYKCVATNQEGTAEHEAAVEVADEM